MLPLSWESRSPGTEGTEPGISKGLHLPLIQLRTLLPVLGTAPGTEGRARRSSPPAPAKVGPAELRKEPCQGTLTLGFCRDQRWDFIPAHFSKGQRSSSARVPGTAPGLGEPAAPALCSNSLSCSHSSKPSDHPLPWKGAQHPHPSPGRGNSLPPLTAGFK